VEAVKIAMPDAAERPPGAVLEHVLDALGNCPTNTQNTNSSICSGEFVNDITGRFYNRMAKSLDFEF
jgi:hypothetical protein